MITVHHMGQSHSHVIPWLMEELDLDYHLVKHQRQPSGGAPQSLRDVHPAAKAPTIEDRGQVMIESTGIMLYILEAYGEGRLRPPPGSPEAMGFLQWLTYMEGSAKSPLLTLRRLQRMGVDVSAMPAAVRDAPKGPFGLIDAALEGRDFLAGDFSVADIQLWFISELANAQDELGPFPNMQAHWARMRARDGFRRAEAKAGPIDMKAFFLTIP